MIAPMKINEIPDDHSTHINSALDNTGREDSDAYDLPSMISPT